MILEQARARPAGAPGGLVVLDACVSDHLAGEFDESVTLSTAFLAAGATGVAGSRWEVLDGPTGLMMYVCHDRLRHGVPLARALARDSAVAPGPRPATPGRHAEGRGRHPPRRRSGGPGAVGGLRLPGSLKRAHGVRTRSVNASIAVDLAHI